MTPKLTHKERAEEFILRLGITGEIRIAGEVSLLTEAFHQIANEALEEAVRVIQEDDYYKSHGTNRAIKNILALKESGE